MIRDEFLGAAGASGGGGGGPSTFLALNGVIAHGSYSSTSICGLLPWNNSTGFGSVIYQYVLPGPSTSGIDVPCVSPNKDTVVFAHPSSPYVYAYPASPSGFGAKYANPSVLPTGSFLTFDWAWQYHQCAQFSPSGNSIMFVGGTAEKVVAYSWSASGFGTKFSAPAVLPAGSLWELSFSPDGSVVTMVSSDVMPIIHSYAWSDTTGFGTKFANPSVLPSYINHYSIDFHPDGNAILLGSYGGTAYKWSSSGFGTKYASVGVFNDGSGGSYDTGKFSPTGGAVAAFKGASPILGYYIYRWTYASGFGAAYASAGGSLPSVNLAGGTFTGDGTALAVAANGNGASGVYGFIKSIEWSDTTGFGSPINTYLYQPSATLFFGNIGGVSFN